MATSILFSRAAGNRDESFQEVIGTAVIVADTIELPVGAVSSHLSHLFVGIQQFDISGDPVLAGAGSYQISIKTRATKEWEDLTGTIDATAPTTQNFAANVSQIRVVPTGITTAVTYSLHVTANRT